MTDVMRKLTASTFGLGASDYADVNCPGKQMMLMAVDCDQE